MIDLLTYAMSKSLVTKLRNDIAGKEDKANKVTSINNNSTDEQYPSAKCIYNALSPKVNTQISGALQVNTIYDLKLQTSIIATLPATAQIGDFIQIDFVSGATATTLSISGRSISDFDFQPSPNTIVTLFCDYGYLGNNNLGNDNYGWRISNAEYTYTPDSELVIDDPSYEGGSDTPTYDY